MNPGDRVKIKEFKYIKTKTVEYNLFIDPDMKKFCGYNVTIDSKQEKSYGTIYKVKENTWWWHEKWLIEDFLTDKDFEL